MRRIRLKIPQILFDSAFAAQGLRTELSKELLRGDVFEIIVERDRLYPSDPSPKSANTCNTREALSSAGASPAVADRGRAGRADPAVAGAFRPRFDRRVDLAVRLRARLESLARLEVSFGVTECVFNWTASYEQTWSHVRVRIQLNPRRWHIAGIFRLTVKYSAGPLPEGCEPLLLISIFSVPLVDCLLFGHLISQTARTDIPRRARIGIVRASSGRICRMADSPCSRDRSISTVCWLSQNSK